MEAKNDALLTVQNPVELLQKLIRFDTTNPPGNEAECIGFINQLLTQAGIETKVLAKTPNRPNLIARLPGQGNSAPLLLYGHADVVTTEGQQWQHPPFEGKIADGCVWGRGALDMKSGIAMMLSACLRLKAENIQLPGEVVLAILSDEEAASDFGARYLVENHPEEFAGVRYAIGEFGGFTQSLGKLRFYPIQVAEKQICWFRAIFRGPGGHGAIPVRGGAMAKAARFLQRLDAHRLPVHITPPVRLMLSTIAAALGGISGVMIRQLLNPSLTDRVLNLMGKKGRLFDPLLHHTVSPTILHGSTSINVIPTQVVLELDGRLLPGFGPDAMFKELRALAGADVELEVIRYDPGPADADLGWFDTLAGILKEADPEGIPCPMMLAAMTDARLFSRLGIQTYGFLPMSLPKDFNFTQMIHTTDERIPVEAVEFGTNAIYQALQRF